MCLQGTILPHEVLDYLKCANNVLSSLVTKTTVSYINKRQL